MKLSTKSTYGLRAMLNIAMSGREHATSIADISKREDISVSYLEQLLNKLRHDGLIKSIRGPKGGYMLSRKPDAITVEDIVNALEGGIYPVHCVANSSCKKSDGCVPKIVWLKLSKAIGDCLGAITLKDLCAEAKRIEK